MNNTKTITGKIVDRFLLKDKFDREYLILKLADEEKIFVFANQIKIEQWDYLAENSEHQFTVKEGNGGNILIDFN